MPLSKQLNPEPKTQLTKEEILEYSKNKESKRIEALEYKRLQGD